jgi:ATP-dependent RNA helicase DDX46/PRP5
LFLKAQEAEIVVDRVVKIKSNYFKDKLIKLLFNIFKYCRSSKRHKHRSRSKDKKKHRTRSPEKTAPRPSTNGSSLPKVSSTSSLGVTTTSIKDYSPKPSLTKSDSLKDLATSSTTTPIVQKVAEPIDKESEQRRLEEEMRKRRERIEKWRTEKKQKEVRAQVEHPHNQVAGKAWNLEDDDEEEDKGDVTIAGATAKQQLQLKRDSILQQKQEQQQLQEQLIRERELLVKQQALENENEEDPLDAYMKEISKVAKSDAKKVSVVTANVKTSVIIKTEPDEKPLTDIKEEPKSESMVVTSKIKIVEGAAKVTKEKGDIMEQDIDGLEYLSDEEAGAAESEEMSLVKPKNKAEMIFTDHTKVYYRPFRKNFYVEVPEIKEMSQEGKIL